MQSTVQDYNAFYLKRIDETIKKALLEHHRTLAIRVDLRLPDYPADSDAEVISRFTDSLKAKIRAYLERKRQEGKRIHPCTLRYAWAREFGPLNGKKHYHVLLLLNKDVWFTPGDYQSESSLAGLIKQAWCSALRVSYPGNATLVHFPENPCLWLDRNSMDYSKQQEEVMKRASYLCKNITKQYGDGERSFGCSQY
ncbi:inovirus Gp2 family protein [Brenneria corticis]|uniref:Inovirus Gp2 family protein n=1 Tax=Brenneria corticis TaxID=2173106 RepID=A0A2U1UBB3_9GAMM|nr:inovirus Gp2 family protein [Brenneria sp. CFCC 11842]PWC18953.1 inovirus Gp2 family protein [Brenneria sp. CFCC 11842]